jgi:hypothetical protein
MRRIRRARAEAVAPPPDWRDERWSLDRVYIADIRDVKLVPDSVDMVFSDPPWSKDGVPLYGELARFAAHCLKPGGFCVAYFGKLFLPDVLSLMSPYLNYRWVFAALQPQNEKLIFNLNLYEAWRPLLLFQKPGEAEHNLLIPEASFSTRQKDDHEFQQDEATARRLIDAYAKPGGIVVDPFTGAGTVLVAAKAMGRHFLGFDADRDAARIASARVHTT